MPRWVCQKDAGVLVGIIDAVSILSIQVLAGPSPFHKIRDLHFTHVLDDEDVRGRRKTSDGLRNYGRCSVCVKGTELRVQQA